MDKKVKYNPGHDVECDIAYLVGCANGFKAANDEARELKIKHVIYSNPATIVFWSDGTKTVVKCYAPDKYDSRTGVLLCCAKRLLGHDKDWFDQIIQNETRFFIGWSDHTNNG